MSGAPIFKIKRQGGAGPKVVLVHGFASDAMSWSANIAALSTQADVYTAEWPAHGANPSLRVDFGLDAFAAHLAEALHRENILSAHFIAHSLGAALTVALAAVSPKSVQTMSLISPLGFGAGMNRGFIKALLGAKTLPDARAALEDIFYRKDFVSAQLAEHLLHHFKLAGVRPALAQLAERMLDWEAGGVQRLAAKLDHALPRQIFWGSNDQINPVDRARVGMLGGTIHVIERAGHLPHIEQAALVNRALTSLLTPAAARP